MCMSLCAEECVSKSIRANEDASIPRAWALLWYGEATLRARVPLVQEYTVIWESDSSLEREEVSSPYGWVQGREADVGMKSM